MNRIAARVLRDRVRENRAARRPHTLASHAVRAGVDADTAEGVAASLRTVARRIGATGTRALVARTVHGRIKGPKKAATRYARLALATVLAAYRPRKAEYVAAKTALLAYATA